MKAELQYVRLQPARQDSAHNSYKTYEYTNNTSHVCHQLPRFEKCAGLQPCGMPYPSLMEFIPLLVQKLLER